MGAGLLYSVGDGFKEGSDKEALLALYDREGSYGLVDEDAAFLMDMELSDIIRLRGELIADGSVCYVGRCPDSGYSLFGSTAFARRRSSGVSYAYL